MSLEVFLNSPQLHQLLNPLNSSTLKHLFYPELIDGEKYPFYPIKLFVWTGFDIDSFAVFVCQLDDLMVSKIGYVKQPAAEVLSFALYDSDVFRSEVQADFIMILL